MVESFAVEEFLSTWKPVFENILNTLRKHLARITEPERTSFRVPC